MQVTLGTVSVTTGSPTVVASVTADDVNFGWNIVPVGAIFVVVGDVVPYFVAALIAPDVSASGFWEITLSANYAGVTGTEKSYSLTTDFTANHALPLINRGDIATDVLWRVAMAKIDLQF